jgi:hypothetical protein
MEDRGSPESVSSSPFVGSTLNLAQAWYLFSVNIVFESFLGAFQLSLATKSHNPC